MRKRLLICLLLFCALACAFLTWASLTGGLGRFFPSGKTCGASTTAGGSYRFSWLHVSQAGIVVDEQGCAVPLVGFNMGGLFLGDAGVGVAGVGAVARAIAWYHQTFRMNLARVAFNAAWWNANVTVPNARMPYRQWLQQYVRWQEDNGNYVELDEGPHFPEPPCGGSVTFCPSQDQGSKDYQAHPGPTTAQELESNIAPGVRAWKDLAHLYSGDPAVIFDAWNEPTLGELPAFFRDMNTLLDTIRSASPRSLLVVYEHGWGEIMAGRYPLYRQGNLAIDAHVYDGFSGTSPATGAPCREPGRADWTPANSGLDAAASYAHAHGLGFILNEWGGCYDTSAYQQQILSFARDGSVGLAYFQAGDVAHLDKATGALQVNGNGRLVQGMYASLFPSSP